MDSVENEENKQKEEALDRAGFKNEGVDILGEPLTGSSESLEEVSQNLKKVANSLEQNLAQGTPQAQKPPEQKQASSQAEEEGYIEVPGGSTFGGKGGTLESEIAQVLQDAEKVPSVSPPAIAINNPGIKPLRTYKTDTEEAIQNQRMSVVTIAVAESKKKEEQVMSTPEEEKVRIPYGALITSFILVALGASAFYVVYLKQTDTQTKEPTKQTEKIIPIVKTKNIQEIDFLNSKNLIYDIALKGSNTEGTEVGDIITVQPISNMISGKTIPSAQSFFEKATPLMPGKLARSLSKEFFIGIHVFDGPTPFIILKTTFFQNAFAGMLEWESTITKDLAPLITLSHGDAKVGAFFIDTVIKNKDVRIVRGSEGKDVLFYTFVDKNTILITTKKLTLEELIVRLTSTTVIR